MRPLDRGPRPADSRQPVLFREYQQARPYLIERIGNDCAYCNMRLDQNVEVEHVQPKSLYPRKRLAWNNLLLSCKNCNATKGDQDPAMNDLFWPDRDNTMRALTYGPGALIEPAAGLSKADRLRAMQTIQLTGLDATPDRKADASDLRWLMRQRAWDRATRAREGLARQPDNILLREQIIETAVADGYWPVWFTVFQDDRDLRLRLIKARSWGASR